MDSQQGCSLFQRTLTNVFVVQRIGKKGLVLAAAKQPTYALNLVLNSTRASSPICKILIPDEPHEGHSSHQRLFAW